MRNTNTITKVKVKLIGKDGNAYSILANVRRALEKAGYKKDFIDQFTKEATAGTYEDLLQTVMTYVIVE